MRQSSSHRVPKGRRSARRVASASFVAGLAAFGVLGSSAAPALAALCDLKVYRSSFGERKAESDTVFKKEEQFQVCFRATQDGFVTLWDRIPTDGDVERLVPNENYTGPGTKKAAKVEKDVERCFGDGNNGYYLLMDPADGDGLGMMWLVFTEESENHPDIASFSTPKDFAKEYKRFGAGSIPAKRPEKQTPQSSCAAAETSLIYLYRVD